MKIYIGSDHTGFELKEKLKVFLTERGDECVDKGATSYNPDDDYPDFVVPVAESVVAEDGSIGIVIGGNGEGEAIACNRVIGARAIVFYGPVLPKQAIDITGATSDDEYEIVRLGRAHDNANILSLGARFISDEEAMNAVRVFLETSFSEEERHIRRIAKY